MSDIISLLYRASQKGEVENTYRAKMGKGDGVTLFIDGKPGYVWARIYMATAATLDHIRFSNVAPGYDKEVIVKKSPFDNIWEAIKSDPTANPHYHEGSYTPDIAPHASMHGYYGADPLFVESLQFQPFSCRPTYPASMSVRVGNLWYTDTNGDPAFFAGGTIDLTSHVPGIANRQRLVVVGLDRSTGSLTAVAGDMHVQLYVEDIPFQFTANDILAISLDSHIEPSAAVRLYYAQTSIQPFDIPPNPCDMRRWITPTGTVLPVEVAVSSGELERTGNGKRISIFSETGTSDDVDTISGFEDGEEFTLQAASGHTITLKHGVDNIEINDASDRVINGSKAIKMMMNGLTAVNLGW